MLSKIIIERRLTMVGVIIALLIVGGVPAGLYLVYPQYIKAMALGAFVLAGLFVAGWKKFVEWWIYRRG